LSISARLLAANPTSDNLYFVYYNTNNSFVFQVPFCLPLL